MKKGIFYFSSINYDFLKQRPQQLFCNLRKITNDYEIFYIEPPRLNIKSNKSIPLNRKNVIMPVPGPLTTLRHGENFFQYFIKTLINYKLKINNFDIKVAILAHPIWEPYISFNDFDVICYDYMDSIELYGFIERHKRLVEKSDVIFTTLPKLKEELNSEYAKEAVLVSNGVDPNFFKERSSLKVDLNKKKKIVGYVGAIYDWIDLEMVYDTANSLENVDFIFIGPISPLNKKKVLSVDKPENVYFLGQKDYELIPPYINLFDVAIIPFKKGDIASSTDPLKLYEYFALGKPVVATSMKQLERFDDGQVLRVTGNSNEFTKSIEFFLENDKETWQKFRKKISKENSWASKANKILKSINKLVLLKND